MWLDEHKKNGNNENKNSNSLLDVSDADSDSSGEELPIWVRGEQRWVSGIASDTTCQEVIQVLLQDEERRVSNAFKVFNWMFEKSSNVIVCYNDTRVTNLMFL